MDEHNNKDQVPEPNKEIDPNLNKALAQFLSGENYDKTIQALIEHKKLDNKAENHHNLWQFGIVFIIIAAIVYCGKHDILEGLSVGILISALLGYVLGSFRQE